MISRSSSTTSTTPNPFTNELALFADLNQDGFVNDSDVTALANIVLGTTPLPDFPLTTLRETSPAAGESGVTVTRETVFRFNFPLATNTFLTTNYLYATFGGRRYLSRIELATDRKTVTLFYLENLPGSARVRVTFDPVALQDRFGRLVDLDGDGVPGGAKIFDFDTLSTTPVPGTAVIGTVYASELVPSPGGEGQGEGGTFTNRPLAGVTITVDGMEEILRAVTDANGFFRLSPCPVGESSIVSFRVKVCTGG